MQWDSVINPLNPLSPHDALKQGFPKMSLVLPNNCQAGTLFQKDKLSETELVLPRLLVV